MNYVNSDMVSDYINNKIEDIKQYIESESNEYEDAQEDLEYLENLSQEDIEEITQKINNDKELQNNLNESMHYWIYHT